MEIKFSNHITVTANTLGNPTEEEVVGRVRQIHPWADIPDSALVEPRWMPHHDTEKDPVWAWRVAWRGNVER